MSNLTVSSAVDTLMQATDKPGMQLAIGVRERLTANRTYYVRTDGNDSNDGLANTSGGAFLTWAKAWDALSQIDGNGFFATIKATGSFTENILIDKAFVGLTKIVIEGDTATPANCTLNASANRILSVDTLTPIDVKGVRFGSTATATAAQAIYVDRGTVTLPDATCVFARVSNCHIILSGPVSRMNVRAGYTISGGAEFHFLVADDAFLDIDNTSTATITLVASPAFSTAFYLIARRAGALFVNLTFSGSISGAAQRYNVGPLSQLMVVALGGAIPGSGQTVDALGSFVSL